MIGDVGMLGEDEKNDLELADVGTNDAEGDVDEGGENLAAADVGDEAGSGTIGEVTDRVRKIHVPMILCPKVLNTDMSLRASAKAIADVFSVGEWARNDSVFQRPIAIESKAGFDDGSPWVDSKCCSVVVTHFEKWDAEAGRLKLEQVCWWLTAGRPFGGGSPGAVCGRVRKGEGTVEADKLRVGGDRSLPQGPGERWRGDVDTACIVAAGIKALMSSKRLGARSLVGLCTRSTVRILLWGRCWLRRRWRLRSRACMSMSGLMQTKSE